MVAGQYVPDTGDIVWIDLNPQLGREQMGRRPFLILTPRSYNGLTSLAVGCPIANNSKGYPFEVALPQGGRTTGVALCDHVKSLDWRSRNAEFRDRAPDSIVRAVRTMIATLLGIAVTA